VFLRQYNEVLIAKLEDKLADAEKANRELVLYRQNLEKLVDSRTTELKKANEELRNFQELKENLTHFIVHDMRSPLTAILGTLELTMAQANLPASVQDDLKKAWDCARRLTEMTMTLLDVSRMEAGKMLLNVAAHDLFDLACSAADSVSILARKKDVRVIVGGSPIVSRCDAGLIRRVIVNLLDNAIKFSPGSEPVELNVTSDQDSALVSVSDNGPGIAPEYHSRVFDKFFQMEARDRGLLPSPGLGLALCKLAVEAHDGRIGIESEPGRGSRFWFALPL
jgi:signal transduction histidine kinase